MPLTRTLHGRMTRHEGLVPLIAHLQNNMVN